jgi:DNA-binding winged helix-turn-helix (wHTH) protein
MKINFCPLQHDRDRSNSATADAALEFGSFRVLLRRRQLLADGVPVGLGTRAFDLLLVLLEADGLLVTKEEPLQPRVAGHCGVGREPQVQVCSLRKALGAERDVIRTEYGRGYRFIGMLCLKWRDARVSISHATKAASGQTLFSQNCRQSLPCNSSSS